ncbi:hypothetical protein E4U55_001627 [Claviceps digitariae]|nr:hypothetical protein E4U55_001627 [Claviceps digitariae]
MLIDELPWRQASPTVTVQSLRQPSRTPSTVHKADLGGTSIKLADLFRRPEAPAPVGHKTQPLHKPVVAAGNGEWRHQSASGCLLEAFMAPDSWWSPSLGESHCKPLTPPSPGDILVRPSPLGPGLPSGPRQEPHVECDDPFTTARDPSSRVPQIWMNKNFNLHRRGTSLAMASGAFLVVEYAAPITSADKKRARSHLLPSAFEFEDFQAP